MYIASGHANSKEFTKCPPTRVSAVDGGRGGSMEFSSPTVPIESNPIAARMVAAAWGVSMQEREANGESAPDSRNASKRAFGWARPTRERAALSASAEPPKAGRATYRSRKTLRASHRIGRAGMA